MLFVVANFSFSSRRTLRQFESERCKMMSVAAKGDVVKKRTILLQKFEGSSSGGHDFFLRDSFGRLNEVCLSWERWR